MNWSEISIWKQCFISTFLCLIGCSIGTMGTAFYLVHHNMLIVFLLSFLAGLFTSIVFIALWNVLFRDMGIRLAVKSSLKMSIVSMVIMIITENVIIVFVAPMLYQDMSVNGTQLHTHSTHSTQLMMVAMSFGFFLSLPYNYYQLQKTGKLCHKV